MLASDVLVSKERFCGRIRHLVLTWAADTGGYRTDEPGGRRKTGNPGVRSVGTERKVDLSLNVTHILLSNHLLF